MKKIAVLVSSVVKNLELAQKLNTLALSLGHKSEIINLVELNLPLYTSIIEERDGVPQKVHDLQAYLLEFDAFIVVAPEYNGGVPPVLNNVIAWISRVSDDFRVVFEQKFVALATHSGGQGAYVIDSMRLMFSYLGANILSRHIITNYSKPYNEKTAKSIIEELIKYS
ncbi:MAG: NAD(P)H-dependent oxidoreductase [Sulfurimonas sp.]|nr:NAD(P)H-dependent oxidoreductase [Sulfurimonas sp.]PHQ91407.1 MAG: hypothetical protein COB42_03590 [Sulfurimonas sp.]